MTIEDDEDKLLNHLHIQGVNYGVDCASRTLSMKELKDVALECLMKMKSIEGEKNE